MFYDKEVKQEFIAEYRRIRVVALSSLTGLFHKTAQFEQAKGKDCCEFTQEEILQMYKDFQAKSVNVLENYNVYLKGYAAFCIKNGIGNTNNYAEINKSLLSDCIDPEIKTQKLITREQLDDIEDELYNWTDKAILECLWNGISGKSMEDLVSLNRSMISEDKRYICFPDGRKVELSDRLYHYLDRAFSETEYQCYGQISRVKKLTGVDCLYKEMDNAYTVDSNDKFFRWVYRRVQTYREYVGMPMLTMKNIQASGLLWYLQNAMKATELRLRDFLRTDEGKKISTQYGYEAETAVDVIANKFKEIL